MHVSVKVYVYVVCDWRMYVCEWNYMDVKDKYESIWKGQIVLFVCFLIGHVKVTTIKYICSKAKAKNGNNSEL